MYKELEEVVHSHGALLFFLPPYSPQLNPIEVGFSLLKRWIQRHANLSFSIDPESVLNVAMVLYTKGKESGAVGLFRHCGYDQSRLKRETFLS
jgi:hypothetical protein